MVFRDFKRVGSFILAFCALAMGGCAVTEAPGAGGARPAAAAVEVIFAPGRLELVQSLPKLELERVEPGAPDASDLYWELVDGSGAVVAEGYAPDSRNLRYESFGEPSMPDSRSSSGTLVAELPNVDGTLRVYEADGSEIGALELSAIDEMPPADGEWIPGKADVDFEEDVLGEPELIIGSGAKKRMFNVLVLPEGYREEEMAQFHDDVRHMVEGFSQTSVYAENLELFNVWSQDVKSAESGISEPGASAKDTAFNVAFGDNQRAPRRCIMPAASWNGTSVANMRRFGRAVNADVIVLLANVAEHGGCARKSEGFLVISSLRTGAGPGYVLAHELGHALFGLADEYGGTSTTCQRGPNLGSRLDALPWSDLIASDTPLPTTDAPEGTVGAFIGGGICDTGRYRPESTCTMRQSGASFCAVCAREMRRLMDERRRMRESK